MCLEKDHTQQASLSDLFCLKTKIINLFSIPLLHVLLVSLLAKSDLRLDQMVDYLHLYFAYLQTYSQWSGGEWWWFSPQYIS